MPKVAICPNGHHYDAEKYQNCPHCATSENASTDSQQTMQHPQEPVVKRKRSIFDASKKHASYAAQVAPETEQAGIVQKDMGRTIPLYAQEINKTVPLYAQEIQKTVPLYAQEIQKTVPLYADDIDPQISSKAIESDDSDEPGEYKEIKQVAENTQVSALQKAVSATNSGAVRLDAKTIGFFDIDEDEPAEQMHTEPTVGWIVCVKGAHKGESFILHSGRNSIGREPGMDIVLSKEATVSRDKHAHIIFDPLNVKFLLQAGDGHGLTYKNGEMVLTYTELQAYDRIILGQAEFVFVSFCNESFNWK